MGLFKVDALAHVQVVVDAESEDEAGYRVMTGQTENPIEIVDVADIENIEDVTAFGVHGDDYEFGEDGK